MQNPETLLAGAEASACGKVILFGEHSVVYGYPALAGVLPNYQLRLRLVPLPKPRLAMHTLKMSIVGSEEAVAEQVSVDVHQALQMALRLASAPFSIEQLSQHYSLELQSEIPLGAGMGGSAALSTALVRLVLLLQQKKVHNAKLAQMANEVDNIFHGNASGLDTSAVSSDGWISFQKGKEPFFLKPKLNCKLVLVDSLQRTATKEMVSGVKACFEANRILTTQLFDDLGATTQLALQSFEEGDLSCFGAQMNRAQSSLNQLGVSTPLLNSLCESMLRIGAVGAKLTGAGGGGLVLAAFPPEMVIDLTRIERKFSVYFGSIS